MKIILIFCICFGVLLEKGICWDDIESLLLLAFDDDGELPFLDTELNPNCRRDLQEFIIGIQEKKHWALSMLDSMEKFPSGLLMGRRMALGQFDECVSVVHPNFTGQHCVVEIAMKTSLPNQTFRAMLSPLERLFIGQFAYGACVPSTCNSTDVKNALKAFGLSDRFMIDVNERNCVAESVPKFRTKDYVAIGFFVFIILLAIGSTIYDVRQTATEKNENQKKKILTSFSLYTNWNTLFQISNNSTEMNSLYGIRFITLTWVVLGHIFLTEYVTGSDVNAITKLTVLNSVVVIPITNAFPSVDTFFFLSGLLVCFVFFRNISGKGSYDAPVALIHRYLRITPSMAVILFFNFTLLSRFSVAPYSKYLFQNTEEACQKYWWAYLLFVQNFFFNSSKGCFAPGWYLAADMQMFLLSPVVLYVLFLWPKIAPLYLCVLTVGSSLSSFTLFYKYDIPPNHTLEYHNVKTINEFYWFHTRITPWFAGVATGYIICGIKAKKIKIRLTKVWVALGWITAAFLCLSSVFGIAGFYPLGYALRHSTLEKSSYRAFHRLGWALGLSWIVIACVSDYGGLINKFLSLNIFQPLSKLSFCAYLVHYSLQLYRNVNGYRMTKNYSCLELIYICIGDLIGSIFLAVPLCLLIEMPFSHLEKILLQKLVIFPYPKTKK